MRMESTSFIKSLLIFFLFINPFSSAYACSPALDAKSASIAEKALDSSFVFDGAVTEVTDTFIKVRVEQYFKGVGPTEVRIAQDPQNSCADHFVLEQRALFFTKGYMGELLEAVYDGAFGSAREMSADNFGRITAATRCMTTYAGGKLTVPCVAHKATKKVYQAILEPISTGSLTFLVSSVEQAADKEITDEHFSITRAPIECMATYEDGLLTVPCIAYIDAQKAYQAKLESISSTGGLKLSLSSAQRLTNTVSSMALDRFDQGTPGTVPDNWEAGITGEGGSDWSLEKDSTAPSSPWVVKQSAAGDYPFLVKQGSRLTDGFVAVKFKPISGSIDQAAGLVWRWKDPYNYYVARANALEDNISIYYMQDGQRTAIKYVDLPSDLPVEQNIWQTLRVDFQGNHFIVSFAGKTIIDSKDNHIKGEGAVGLWTKEDSVTSFDDFVYGKREDKD